MVEVINDVIHVNVPLTPGEAGEPAWVALTTIGPWPQVITVPVGSTVEWVAWLDASTPITDLVWLTENPVWQPRTGGALDPLVNTLGFDGGMLAPGQMYWRQFVAPGVYPYTDGAGHAGQVVVQSFRIYLPLVIRQ